MSRDGLHTVQKLCHPTKNKILIIIIIIIIATQQEASRTCERESLPICVGGCVSPCVESSRRRIDGQPPCTRQPVMSTSAASTPSTHGTHAAMATSEKCGNLAGEPKLPGHQIDVSNVEMKYIYTGGIQLYHCFGRCLHTLTLINEVIFLKVTLYILFSQMSATWATEEVTVSHLRNWIFILEK